MKKKKSIILILTIIIIVIVAIPSINYYYQSNKEYKYICFNKNVIIGTYIEESYLEECTTKEKLPNGVITNKKELLSTEKDKVYKQTKNTYDKGEMLYKKDFILYDTESIEVIDIALLNEIEVISTATIENGLPTGFLEEPIKYNIHIKNNKLYATNLNTKEEKLIFDKEEVKHIALRPYCCAGNGKLLIITTSGNVYISINDCNYFFSFDFPFEKLDVSNIVSFKLIAKGDNDVVKSLYGITSNGKEIFITEPDW